MKKWRWVAFSAALLSGCATVGQVRTDFDDKANFQKFKTYAFIDPKDIQGTGVLSNSIIRQRVEGLLTENLAARGLSQAATGQESDLVVQYWVGVEEKTDVAFVPSSRSSYGPYYQDHWRASYDHYVPYNYREGTLIVDLIDRTSKDLVWRAYLVQALEENKDTNLKNARKSLEKAFAEYPPKVK